MSPVQLRYAVGGLTAVTSVVVLLDAGPPVRPVVVALFMLIAPGAAVLSQVRSLPPLVWWTAAVATSLGIDVLLSTALLYLRWWSPTAVFACLAAVCLGGCAAGPLRERTTV